MNTFFLLFSLFFIVVYSAEEFCEGTVDSIKYDLSGLAKEVPGTIPLVGSDYTYYFRLCGVISGDDVSGCLEQSKDSVACQHVNSGIGNEPFKSLGDLSTAKYEALAGLGSPEGFQIVYSGGWEDRTVTIEFHCNKTVKGKEGLVTDPTEPITKQYHIVWNTPYGCEEQPKPPKKKGGSKGNWATDHIGAILLIILLVVIVCYLVFGTLVNKFALKKEGIEILPNARFWMALPFLVIDGHKYVFGLCARCCCRSKYQDI